MKIDILCSRRNDKFAFNLRFSMGIKFCNDDRVILATPLYLFDATFFSETKYSPIMSSKYCCLGRPLGFFPVTFHSKTFVIKSLCQTISCPINFLFLNSIVTIGRFFSRTLLLTLARCFSRLSILTLSLFPHISVASNSLLPLLSITTIMSTHSKRMS